MKLRIALARMRARRDLDRASPKAKRAGDGAHLTSGHKVPAFCHVRHEKDRAGSLPWLESLDSQSNGKRLCLNELRSDAATVSRSDAWEAGVRLG